MTPELTALLQKEANGVDTTAQHVMIGELARLSGMEDAAPGWYGETRRVFADHRRAVALAVMRECAKLVCGNCRTGEGGGLYKVNSPYWKHENGEVCQADVIHAAISEAEAAQ